MRSLPPTPTKTVLNSLGVFAAGKQRTEQDLLCLMILFHTHRITFRRPIFPDRPGILEMAALTRHGAAEIAAAVWSGKRKAQKNDIERTDDTYWYHLFLERGAYEMMEDVPDTLLGTVLALRARLLEHPDIDAVEVED